MYHPAIYHAYGGSNKLLLQTNQLYMNEMRELFSYQIRNYIQCKGRRSVVRVKHFIPDETLQN